MTFKYWEPKIGPDFNLFLDKVVPDARDKLKETCVRILSRCCSPGQRDSSTVQLVVGEVQSGKTMSFTGTIALARDNHFPLIIVLGGTKDNLLTQTKNRLEKDLGALGDGGANRWNVLFKPDASKAGDLVQKLQTWDDPNLKLTFKQTTLLLTLKSVKSLSNTRELLEEVGKRVDLNKYPVLIIDDEADQASLNTKVHKNEQSSFYTGVLNIRKAVPLHSFLMYTATPQATLLLKIVDLQSPETVTLLQSGEEYVGGPDLFDSDNRYAKVLDHVEVDIALNSNKDQPPPNSLKESLAVFVLSIVIAQERQYPRPVSMLVHPGAKRDLHEQYENWVKNIISNWRNALSDQTDIAYKDIKDKWFIPALDELIRTVDISDQWSGDGDAVLDGMLKEAAAWLSQIQIQVVNSTEDENNVSPEDWLKKPAWIVVGGAKLDRGFTIENLITTYMPRSEGMGMADTIQQRGRFFGYKRRYLDLLRGWFNEGTKDIFQNYVEHEKVMHDELRELDENKLPLKEWRRRFLLDSNMKPTRKSVISLKTHRRTLEGGFIFKQERLYDKNLAKLANQTLDQFKELFDDAIPDENDKRDTHKNLFVETSIEKLLEILESWPVSLTERESLDEIVFAIRTLLDENYHFDVCLYFMDSLNLRTRGPRKDFKYDYIEDLPITNLFTGPQQKGERYLGDDSMRHADKITIQIHKVYPTDPDIGAVAALAIAWPENIERSVIFED